MTCRTNDHIGVSCCKAEGPLPAGPKGLHVYFIGTLPCNGITVATDAIFVQDHPQLMAVAGGAHVLVATFGPEGPDRCSGLDVVRYSADGLHAEFGGEFTKAKLKFTRRRRELLVDELPGLAATDSCVAGGGTLQ